MLYLKKYFTEGLTQIAILLSLCGVRVDVGLEPYLPPSWHEVILGPSSALTQTQFHNFGGRLEEGHGLHPKTADLDAPFMGRRLLGWVRTLDRLQVPHAEVETWLVQREPDPLPVQSSPLERAPAVIDRDQVDLPAHGAFEEDDEDEEEGELNGLHHCGSLDDRGEEDLVRMQRCRNAEAEGPFELTYSRGQTEDEADHTAGSLQECLRMMEETFPFADEQQLSDADGMMENLDCQPSDQEPLLPPIISTDALSLDLELQWQDVLAIMEPENTDIYITRSSEQALVSSSHGASQHGSEALPQYQNNFGPRGNQEVPVMEAAPQDGLLSPQSQSEVESALLPLIPSAELNDQSSPLNTLATDVDHPHTHVDQLDLLVEDSSDNFYTGLNELDNLSTFNMNLVTPAVVDSLGQETHHVNFNSNFAQSLESMTQDLLVTPTSAFLEGREDIDNDDLPSPLSDLLQDASILDEIRLLDLSLEEGFSPEMAVMLEEEGYLNRGAGQEGSGRNDDHFGFSMAATEDRGQPNRHQQDAEDEADSDSGLSLDFSHSPASPCTSEASSYSSSSASSSSCSSPVGSHFSEDEHVEESWAASDMEVEIAIKQEELEEEEMGAVGGEYPDDTHKLFISLHGDHRQFNDFPWLENIGHDHTYIQPQSSDSSSLGKIMTSPTRPVTRHVNAKPYHRSPSTPISEAKIWSRDERLAQSLKIPFSNELIVELPVYEFNELLSGYHLSEEQLALIRDIRRRGKNKIAAQNCRKRKVDVLLGLENNVAHLRQRRSRLLREKQEALRNLQEMRHRLGMLYQEVFARLRDEEGHPLDAAEFMLHFGQNGRVTVASRQQEAELPHGGGKNGKKQKEKKK
ncbi:endoplasmic reticulum membrane sensor NFE2L1a [Pholidichthys leucotaenia]